ncbi:chromatin modification-related protein Yng2p [[Candida] railenensis]|uniref:Chromatin modification-related protein n=1 Tax=[Candida] railenensis TaxID=45579 RepID=A0A9P0QRF1_9ASCO|nr:chromatin modification-related protein Yng2p [[Candida] railenensis]
MDTTTVLDKYTQDLSNLPLEVKHLLQELKTKDVQLQETRKKCQTKDSQIHKFIRANGTLTKHPKEQQLYAKIEEDMAAMKKIQKEKILLANTALFLISKHLCNFETDITKLERDGLLPLVENVMDLDNASDSAGVLTGISDGLSGTATPKPVDSSGSVNAQKRIQKRKHLTVKGTSSLSGNGSLNGSFGNGNINGGGNSNNRPLKRNRSEDIEDDGPSFGLSGSFGGGSAPAGTGMQITASAILNGGSGGAGSANGEDADNNLYCFCQRVSFGEMIGCDNDDCKYEWFHWACVGITSPPKDDEIWYCPDCSPKMEKRKKKRKT